MIKRYTPHYYEVGEIAAMAEYENGGYVRYADIAHLLKENTIDEHRAEFERFASSHGLSVSKTDTDLHASHTVGWMWKAWKAAKGVKE